MKKYTFAAIFIITIFLVSCLSIIGNVLSDYTISGVIVERLDSNYSRLRINIDGKNVSYYTENGKYGYLYRKSKGGYRLSNGQHSIYAYSGSTRSDTIYFVINNDRHNFTVNYKKNEESYVIELKEISITPITKKYNNTTENLNNIDKAIKISFDTIDPYLSNNIKIAVINIFSSDKNISEYVLEELSVYLVNSRKYSIVDRKTLDTIRQEQRFQMAGEVDDNSAIAIGQFSGANVVITGSITGEGQMRRLRLKALDVKTAQILAMSSEKL
jgi:hypothetical protein